MKCVGILLLQLLITATGFWYVFQNPQKPAQIAEALRYASMSWLLLAGLVTVWLKSLPRCAGRFFLATPFARLRSKRLLGEIDLGARLKCTWAANNIRSRERIGFILK